MSGPNVLEQLLAREYSFNVIADPDGGYVIEYPDLPGCITQVEAVEDVAAAAEDIRRLWIETSVELGQSVPEPTYPATYSGKFNVRIPKSLHRRLAERAAEEAVSLNQLVVAFLSGAIERVSPQLNANPLDSVDAGSAKREPLGGWDENDRLESTFVIRNIQIDSPVVTTRVIASQRVFETTMPSRELNIVPFRRYAEEEEAVPQSEEVAV